MNFVVDVRLKETGSNVIIEAGPVFRIDLQDATIAGHLEETGRWNRIEAVVEEGKHWLVVNGNRMPFDAADRNSRGKRYLETNWPSRLLQPLRRPDVAVQNCLLLVSAVAGNLIPRAERKTQWCSRAVETGVMHVA